MTRNRTKKTGEPLRPYPKPDRTESFKLPGFTGLRPILSFILEVLKGTDPGMMRLALQIATRSTHPYPEWIDLAADDPTMIAFAEEAMVSTMKEIADLWIDSGKDAAHPELDTPSKRNIEDILRGQDSSLFQRLQRGLFNTHTQWLCVDRYGKRAERKSPPWIDTENAATMGIESTLGSYGRKVAMYHFAQLLNSQFSNHFSRCDNCARYFAYDRAPRHTIKNGIFCPLCKPFASVVRTQASRERQHRQRMNLAANVWERWKSESHGPRSKWVAMKVSAELRGTEITGRWVTQNETEIMQEVERRKTNAKS